MRNGGMLSPHTSLRQKGAPGGRGVGSGSTRSTSAVPASPLGVMSNNGNYAASGTPQADGARTPAWAGPGAGGTPTAAGGENGGSPFSWPNGQEGTSQPLSAPLSQQFTDAAHKVVHDEVMKVCCPARPLASFTCPAAASCTRRKARGA